MFAYTRAALSLEQAAKSAAEIRDAPITAHYLGKAERIILKSSFNTPQVRALISLYDRVLTAAQSLATTIPIEQNCHEMKKLLNRSIAVSDEVGEITPDRLDSPNSAELRELAQISYVIAHIFMPKCVHSDPKMMIDYFSKPPKEAAALWYWVGCKLRGATPSHEHSGQFRVHTGSTFDRANYYVLEYPKPPPFDDQKFAGFSQIGSQSAVPPYGAPCLALYFSGIIHRVGTPKFTYIVMGQGLGGATRLRTIGPGGLRANLGSRPERTLEAFLTDLFMMA